MITLQIPPSVLAQLGGSTTVSYDRCITSSITFDVAAGSINGQVRISSTAAPEMTPILGSFTIAGSKLEVVVADLDYRKRITLTAGQIASYQGWINAAQNNLEQGFVSVGAIAGTQATGV